MRERAIETYLVRRVRELGGRAYKWASPGSRGVPDRLVFLPGRYGRPIAVEVKAPGKRPTALQLACHRDLRRLEVPVAVVDSREAVDALLGTVLKAAA